MKYYIALIIQLTITLGVHAQNLNVISNCATNPPNFSKLPYKEADEAAFLEDDLIGREAKTICPEYITNLVNQLRYGQLDNDNKVLAIWLLGELHPIDANSIDVLIEYVDLKATKLDPKTRIRRWGDYPAEEALIKIGMPTVNHILNHLSTETNELRRHLMCVVLVEVEGKKGEVFNGADGKAITQNQIKHKLADESDSTRRANLEAALKELEK